MENLHSIMKDGFFEVTLGDWMSRVARFYPDNDAIVNVPRGVRVTYSQLDKIAVKVARGLLSMGVGKGDHVAIWATNYPEWLYLLFGCAKIGAVLVTVNTDYKVYELEYLLRQSDSKCLFFVNGKKNLDYVNILRELIPGIGSDGKTTDLNIENLPRLKNIVYIQYDADSPSPDGFSTWADMMAAGESVDEQEVFDIGRTISPHDIVNMQYTSGTTGFPKGVMLTHYNIINNGYYIGENLRFCPEDRLCLCVTLFHCFGLVLATMASVTHATALVTVDYFRPTEVLNSIEKERCTAVHAAPTMFIFMMDHPDFKKYDISSLYKGIMAGSVCPENLMRRVVEEMGMTGIVSTYGQTEASPATTMSCQEDPLELRVTTVGRHMPFVETKIVDPETGLEVPDGNPGEFCSRGYNTMRGYYNMEEATRAVIDSEGWLHSGDLAIRDPNGYYRITGRIKDMIIRGGENVYPKEIEELLYNHPQIQDVQVVAAPSKKFGEEIMAYIILKEGETSTEKEIQDYVAARMAKFKIPSFVRFLPAFPMTASGKIQKFKLREMAKEDPAVRAANEK